MNNRKIKSAKEILLLGYNEENHMILITLIISSKSVRIKLKNNEEYFCIVLCKTPLEKHDLLNKIKEAIKDKKTQKLNTDNKYSSYYYRNFPVNIVYENNNYHITINVNDSLYKSYLLDINKIEDLLKERLIQPGDKFIGLEAIKPIDFKDGKLIWKARCLLCNRIIEVREDHLKENKSCSCSNNKHFRSDKERFYSYIDKQENIPKDKQIRGTLGIDEEPCWLWTGHKQSFGYGTLSINDKPKLAHRFSWEITNNEKLNNTNNICHRCDNPFCVNPSHLFKGTTDDNIRDKINKRRHSYGESHGMRKLNNNAILKIRNSNKSCIKLSKEFNVSDSTIGRIKNKKLWKHLK